MNTPAKGFKKMLPSLFLVVALILVSYIGVCWFVSKNRDSAFNAINLGNTESMVINALGKPSMREKQGVLFNRYATSPCVAPCVERLWFENRMMLNIEAWSIELDQSGRVIKKYHWVSP